MRVLVDVRHGRRGALPGDSAARRETRHRHPAGYGQGPVRRNNPRQDKGHPFELLLRLSLLKLEETIRLAARLARRNEEKNKVANILFVPCGELPDAIR